MANGATIEHEAKPLWGGDKQPFGADYGKMMMWFFLLSDALSFSGFLAAMGFYRFKYENSWPVAENVFTHFPFIHGDAPLLFVALMTFILILSSVTMVMAVNAGHQMNKKGVVLWMGLTIIGGFFFLGSQAWEWSHFISGDKGGVQLETNEVLYLSDADGKIVTLSELIIGGEAAHGGHYHFTTEQLQAAFAENKDVTLRDPGKTKLVYPRAQAEQLMKTANVIQGANLTENEYGNVLFADFFFFVTGFHGFHVFSGVVINIIIFINVIMGTYQKRGHYEMVEKVGLYWHFVDLVWVFVFTFFYLV